LDLVGFIITKSREEVLFVAKGSGNCSV